MAWMSLLAFSRPVTGSGSYWRTWIRQTAGVRAQSEGWYARDGVLFTDDMWGYPDELICENGYVYQMVYVPGTPNEAHYWLQIDWDSDGDWDDIYYFPEIVYFTGNSWSKTYTHSPESVTIGGKLAPVGGVAIPVDKLALLAPYIALAVAVVAVALGAVSARKRWFGKAVLQGP